MTVSFKWFGHSAFSLDIDGHAVVIDPFLTGNPVAISKADDVEAEVILMTHAHGDHVGDSVDIAKRTGATVVCNFEMGNWYSAQGVENVFQGNPGGTFRNDWMSAKWTLAFHSSSFPDGTYGGQPNGVSDDCGSLGNSNFKMYDINCDYHHIPLCQRLP